MKGIRISKKFLLVLFLMGSFCISIYLMNLKVNAEGISNPYYFSYRLINNGGNVTTRANGKPKVLIYYINANTDYFQSTTTTTSTRTMQAVQDMADAGTLPNADFVFIDISRSTEQQIIDSKQKRMTSSAYYAFDPDASTDTSLASGKNSDAYNHCLNYYKTLYGSFPNTYPVVAYIDANNILQYCSVGQVSADEFISNLKKYCSASATGGGSTEPEYTYTMEVLGNSVSIGDGYYTVNYKVVPSDGFLADNSTQMIFKYAYPNGTTTTVSQKMSEKTNSETVNGKQSYTFSLKLSAKDIGATVTAYMKTSSNFTSNQYNYSIGTYAQQVIDGSGYSSQAKELVKSILNYGTYVQNYFDYYTEYPANSVLPAYDKKVFYDSDIKNYSSALASKQVITEGHIDGFEYSGSRLVLDNPLEATVCFDIDDPSRLFNWTASANNSGFMTASVLIIYSYETVPHYTISDVSINNLENVTTITVREQNGNSYTVKYSPLGYMYSVLNNSTANKKLTDLVCALYCYYNAAKSYQATL